MVREETGDGVERSLCPLEEELAVTDTGQRVLQWGALDIFEMKIRLGVVRLSLGNLRCCSKI